MVEGFIQESVLEMHHRSESVFSCKGIDTVSLLIQEPSKWRFSLSTATCVNFSPPLTDFFNNLQVQNLLETCSRSQSFHAPARKNNFQALVVLLSTLRHSRIQFSGKCVEEIKQTRYQADDCMSSMNTPRERQYKLCWLSAALTLTYSNRKGRLINADCVESVICNPKVKVSLKQVLNGNDIISEMTMTFIL